MFQQCNAKYNNNNFIFVQNQKYTAADEKRIDGENDIRSMHAYINLLQPKQI